MQMVDMNLNMRVQKNPHLINALDRSNNRPLNRKYRNISLDF